MYFVKETLSVGTRPFFRIVLFVSALICTIFSTIFSLFSAKESQIFECRKQWQSAIHVDTFITCFIIVKKCSKIILRYAIYLMLYIVSIFSVWLIYILFSPKIIGPGYLNKNDMIRVMRKPTIKLEIGCKQGFQYTPRKII